MGLEASKVTQVLRNGTSVLADIRGPDLLMAGLLSATVNGWC
jgi:hypothetical protein